MKLATLQTDQGSRIVGVSGDDANPTFIDLTAVDSSLPNCMRGLLAEADGIAKAQAAFEKGLAEGKTITGRVLAPIQPGKIVCIGLNYADHAAETGAEIPSEPVCFGKFGNTIIGQGDTIKLPAVSSQVDYEAELVVVIGKRGYQVSKKNAFDIVAGYCNGNDVSARDWQKGRPGKQWLLGKTPDTFAPIGPWIVTKDEVADPHNMPIKLRLNGETMQDGNTNAFIFGIDEVIEHLTKIMTLEPGDIIFTGTPPGVGMGRDPHVWLQSGDKVEVEIAGLGVLQNSVE